MLLLTLIASTGCARFDYQQFIAQGEVTSDIIASQHFQHRLLYSPRYQAGGDSPLHLYIGGDGNPWHNQRLIAADPTPHRATLLQAMLHDASEAVYIGRPCYYHTQDSACESALWWTQWRYHPRIIDSLQQVIEQEFSDRRPLWLIGYSGGGTLAVLVAQRLSRPVTVVTYGANLDHEAWTAHHQYTALKDSLNPLSSIAHNPESRELHWYGTDDDNILPAWTRAYCEIHANAQCRPITASHTSDWIAQWPTLLKRSKQLLLAP